MEEVKAALADLLTAVLKGLKILIVYIIPATLAALLVSPELRAVLMADPKLMAYAPLINLGFSIIAGFIKPKLSDDSTLKKVL